MKGILITPDNAVNVLTLEEPFYKGFQKAVGGYFEIVRPISLPGPYRMVINEEGKINGLPINPIASYLYGSHIYGDPIVGNLLILKEGFDDGEPDLVGLDDDEIDKLISLFSQITNTFERSFFK